MKPMEPMYGTYGTYGMLNLWNMEWRKETNPQMFGILALKVTQTVN